MSSNLASTHAAAVSESICDGPTYANDRPATAPDFMSAIAVIADGSEVAIAHVQLDREPIDDPERLVRGHHYGQIGRDGVLEVERVEVTCHLGGGSPVLGGGGVVRESRVPEILLEDETPRLVHDNSAVQAEPHHVGVELVSVREVHILPQGERVVVPARRDSPALRKDT